MLAASAPAADKYTNPELPAEERAEDLLSRLTLEQKVSLMMNSSPAIPELGIREYDWWSEALHGCARAGIATVFPQAIGMASSWNDELLKQVFTVASDEHRIKFKIARREGNVRRYHGLTVWTPNINIFRDPRWGRGQETYGEDPYLTTRMGYAAVTGLQGENDGRYDKLHACLKHFAVHSGPEGTRHSFDVSDISYRDFIETYLYAFENLITTTDVQEVMCAYNSYDGKPCCGNDQLLVQLLREKWGYKGLIVSDCWAIRDFYSPTGHQTFPGDAAAAAANAVLTGTDVECGSSYKSLLEAVERGKITEADIDVSVRRLLTARFRLGEMDPDSLVSWNSIPEDRLACEESRALALKMARESMVLLQNDGILPLKKKGLKYFVMGPNAADSVVLNGNYNGTPVSSVTALEGIVNKIGVESLAEDWTLADVVIYVGGLHPDLEGEEKGYGAIEGYDKGDRTTIELPAAQRKEIKEIHATGKKIVFVNMSGSAVALLPETQRCSAILQAWYPGEEGGNAVADILYGNISPSAKLSVSYPNEEVYEAMCYNYSAEKDPRVQWPFGYGLSYTTFGYDDLDMDANGSTSDKFVSLSFKVTNTGSVAADEIVQIYVSPTEDGQNIRPIQLQGFARVSLEPGQTKKVKAKLYTEQFGYYTNDGVRQWNIAPGTYEVKVGASSEDIRLSGRIVLKGKHVTKPLREYYISEVTVK